jgi:hypothetical protein
MTQHLTPRDRGLHAALQIQRQHDPRQWRAMVDAIADPEERKVAEDYLRSIIERMRALKALRDGEPRR